MPKLHVLNDSNNGVIWKEFQGITQKRYHKDKIADELPINKAIEQLQYSVGNQIIVIRYITIKGQNR